MRNTNLIMNDGIKCLISNLGVVETEVFISNLIREPFDYTEWRKEQFDGLSLEELNKQAAEYAKKHSAV